MHIISASGNSGGYAPEMASADVMHPETVAFLRATLVHACVTRRKHHRPGIAPNANTTHVPTTGSSAAPTKPNHTPSRHPRAKGKLRLQTVTPHAAGSRRTHVSRTQECARTHPVTRRATTQYLHTQNVTTRRGCGRNDNQDSPTCMCATLTYRSGPVVMIHVHAYLT